MSNKTEIYEKINEEIRSTKPKMATINAYNAKSQLQGHSARLDFEDFDEQLRKNRYAFTQLRYLYDNPKFVDLDFFRGFYV